MPEVIVVDDDPLAGGLMTDVLEEAGYTVQWINESAKAIAAIKAGMPRLVVLDILMPGIDGMTLLKTIKEDPQIKDIKCVMVSGKAFQADQDRALRMGASGFITKPYSPDTVAKSIANLVGPPLPKS